MKSPAGIEIIDFTPVRIPGRLNRRISNLLFRSTSDGHPEHSRRFELLVMERPAVIGLAAAPTAALCHLNFRRRPVGGDLPNVKLPGTMDVK